MSRRTGGSRRSEGPWPEAAGQRARTRRAAAYKVVKREKDRWWEERDPQDELVCVTVYKRGAVEVVRRLAA
ncbi:MAG: hypothetical protein LC667_13510 [Thioalkalivibrio sp.]|nr:hypothetical protein [Thioalkalivibrio sp.]